MELLDIHEVANEFHVKESTIRRWLKKRDFPGGSIINGVCMWNKDELKDWWLIQLERR